MLVELYFEEGVRFFKISHNAIKMIVIMFLIPLCTAAHKKKWNLENQFRFVSRPSGEKM